MFEINGKYTQAKVMIDEVEESCVGQIVKMASHEAFTNPIAIMPDTHAGKGSVIGFTMEMGDKIIPNIVGVDIGCGMLGLRFGTNLFASIRKDQLDREIRKEVPFGMNVRKSKSKHFRMNYFTNDVNKRLKKFHVEYQNRFNTKIPFVGFHDETLEEICKVIGIDYGRAVKSIGTLGGGNHFIEVGKSETGEYVITIHCGSRNFGKCVAEYWQKEAVKSVSKPSVSKGEYIQWVKNTFRKKEYAREIARYQELYGVNYVAKGTEYLTDMGMYGYLYMMVVAQTYAEWNRKVIACHIKDVITKLDDQVTHPEDADDWIETVHNFIDFNDWIVRKGAIASYEGMQMIIPWNMEDGLIIAEGKSNPEWNYSAPHGAGRLFSRSDAKRKLNLADAEKSMKDKGIYSSSIPLDECKNAYKDSSVIEACIEPTATIIDRVVPVMNMKDGK